MPILNGPASGVVGNGRIGGVGGRGGGEPDGGHYHERAKLSC